MSSGAGTIFRAALRAYKAPCGEPDSQCRCRHWDGCQRLQMACEAFRDFTLGVRATGRRRSSVKIPARVPSRALYQQLYQETDDAID